MNKGLEHSSRSEGANKGAKSNINLDITTRTTTIPLRESTAKQSSLDLSVSELKKMMNKS